MLPSILNLNSRSALKNWKAFIRAPISILKAHQEYSGKKLQYFDPELNENYVPYVIETSIGLDRTFLAVLSYAYNEEKLEDGSERVVLKIPAVPGSCQRRRSAAGQKRRTS